MFYSPLRYPGGKNKLSSFLAKVCIINQIHGHYIEPYAGGASVALFLLIQGYVKKITINDKDRSVFAFWYSVINNTDQLCQLIDETDITIENWHLQKAIQKSKETVDLLTLGFSTLFLNRTNRSGILTGGVIGGVNQISDYKIGCRFNKEEIKKRIRQIAKYKCSITVCNMDAIDLIDDIESKAQNRDTILYFDPPYYLKADSLYMNYYKNEHHKEVSDRIKRIVNMDWIVSYDDHEFIESLYQGFESKKYSFNHSAFSAREGREILFFSSNLLQPLELNYNPIGFKEKNLGNRKFITYKNKV